MITEQEMTLVFKARNIHAEACGQPPRVINETPGQYVGYFEGDCGDQWVFAYDRESKRGTLRGGDADWSEIHEVVDGVALGLILSPPEATWLRACWAAATGISMKGVPCDPRTWLATLARNGVPSRDLRDFARTATELADEIDARQKL
jgi:hypothetical protein